METWSEEDNKAGMRERTNGQRRTIHANMKENDREKENKAVRKGKQTITDGHLILWVYLQSE